MASGNVELIKSVKWLWMFTMEAEGEVYSSKK